MCGWIAERSPLPDWMRPDKAGVILLARYFEWSHLPVDVGVPAERGISDEAITWLKNFSFGRKRLLLYQIDAEWFALGPPAFQQDMARRMSSGEQFWAQLRV